MLPTGFTKFLLIFRTFIGLSFGLLHLYQRLFLVWLQIEIQSVFTLANKFSLFAGGMAYFFIVIMMLTTFPSIRSGFQAKNWKLIHTIGVYWILSVFISTYLKKVMNASKGHIILMFLIIALLGRIYLLGKEKNGIVKF
jgi:hypothetical protein